MKKNICEHGYSLPRGLWCDRGYLILTITHKGRHVPSPGCGPHTKETHALACERLAKIRSEIMRGKFGYEPELPEKTFDEVVPLYLKIWSSEKNGDGRAKHDEASVRDCKGAIERNLVPFFGKMKFHEIRSTDIERRREQRIAQGVLGTTVNREHVPLSSIFSNVDRWMKLEKIPLFKTPAVNPCEAATKAKLRVHNRLLSDYEVRKLKLACLQLQDFDGWEICKLILKTVLSVGDLKKLDIGQTIDIERAKTGVPITIPITLLQQLKWTNWPTRWKLIRREAGLSIDRHSPEYVDAKVLRKTGINWMIGSFDLKLASQYAGHATIKTTEGSYAVRQMEKMRPLAEFMDRKVEDLEKNGGLDGI